MQCGVSLPTLVIRWVALIQQRLHHVSVPIHRCEVQRRHPSAGFGIQIRIVGQQYGKKSIVALLRREVERRVAGLVHSINI